MNLIWGLNLIASKVGVGEFPPIFFTAMRFGSLALFLVPMLRIRRGQMVNLFAAAMLTGPAAFALLFAIESFARAILVTVIPLQAFAALESSRAVSLMFTCVGVLYDRVHSRMIKDYGGVVNTMPRFAALFVFFAMANAGRLMKFGA